MKARNCGAVFSVVCLLWSPSLAQHRESILDRVVHTEKGLVTEVPGVFRWCDSLHLKSARVDAGGCGLFVEEEGAGVPLILINGGPGGTHHYFHPWFSRAKDYARVIYYDQRGCGLSGYRPGTFGYSVEQAVDDLDSIRRALGIGKWVVLGYSYGGFLAQYYALRYPGNLAGLILLGAAPGMRTPGGSREDDFVSQAEETRMKEIRDEIAVLAKQKNWSREKTLSLSIYNLTLNGDWKRQHFYRPSMERAAQMSLYEWVHDSGFNGVLNKSEGKVDLSGAFKDCPVPTLILEGKWDFTWGADKPELLHANHPGSKLVVFSGAAHGIYDEETDRFFSVLKEFMTALPAVPESDLARYHEAVAAKGYYEAWNKSVKDTLALAVESAGWGRSSGERLAESYKRDWVDRLDDPMLLLKIGFALYDATSYREALMVFEKMEGIALRKANDDVRACALIWQAHMLDLLGERARAVERYRVVADMNNPGGMQHDQYRLRYSFTPYAKERMTAPFVRIENAEEQP